MRYQGKIVPLLFRLYRRTVKQAIALWIQGMSLQSGDWVIATYLSGLDPHPQSAFARIIEEKEEGVYIVRIISRCYDPPRIEEKKKTIADEDCKRMGEALIEREKLKFNLWLEHYRRWRYQGLYSPERRTLRQLKELWS